MSAYIHQFVDKICIHHDTDRAELYESFAEAMSAAAREVLSVDRCEVVITGGGVEVHAPELVPLRENWRLNEALEWAVSDVVLRWFPWSPLREGSVGRLLQDGGAWLCGLRGTSNDVTLEIVGASLAPKALQPNSTWLEHQMTFALERGDERSEYTVVATGDHEGNVRDGLELLASIDSRERVEESLALMAEELEERDWGQIGGLNRWPLELLAAAQRAPATDSLFAWCRDGLVNSLLDEPLVIELDGGRIEVKREEAWLNDAVLSDFKDCWVNVLALRYEADNLMDAVETSLSAGFLTSATYESAVLTEPLKGYATTLFEMWRERTMTALRECFEEFGSLELGRDMSGMNPLRLIEFAHRHGLPSEPHVPPFDDAAFERAAAMIEEPSAADAAMVAERYGSVTAKPMALLRVGAWLLVFGADQTVPPHYVSEIWLHEDGSDEAVQVLLTDVWNPTTRWSIDGDAFAFRRFTQWVRRALEEAGIDETYEFAADEWDEEPEPSQLTLAQWLLFDRVGDDSDMLDWRCEHYIVAAGRPLQGAAGMFGFGADFVKKLEEGSHAAIWRRFLREVVDARFG